MRLDLPRYDLKALEPLRVWVEANRSWLAGTVALPDAARLKENLMRYVGSWLKAVGLKQKRTGDSHARTYALEIDVLKTTCNTLKKRHTLFSREPLKEKSVCVPPTPPKTVAVWLAELLDQGRLDAFGSDRVETIWQKLAENTVDWLRTLATSRELGRVLGVSA